MTTIYNFALKMETSLAKSVVKAILETKNANNFKECNVKKNSSFKSAKRTIKN